jgi:hypothetical protein
MVDPNAGATIDANVGDTARAPINSSKLFCRTKEKHGISVQYGVFKLEKEDTHFVYRGKV